VNYPHLHLLINHVPILGSIFALLLMLWAMQRGHRELRRLALWVALFVGLSSYPAYLTGDEAHEQVEDFPGIDHDAAEEHEESAELAMVIMLVTAGVSGLALFLGRGERTEPRWVRGAVLLGLVASSATVAKAAWDGGTIRHEEIRGPLTAAPTLPPGTAPVQHRHEE
jgi:peptidoglycan/LPS O-acetylase OafA/YrhL